MQNCIADVNRKEKVTNEIVWEKCMKGLDFALKEKLETPKENLGENQEVFMKIRKIKESLRKSKKTCGITGRKAAIVTREGKPKQL